MEGGARSQPCPSPSRRRGGLLRYGRRPCSTVSGRVLSTLACGPQFLPADRRGGRVDWLRCLHAHSLSKPAYVSQSEPVTASLLPSHGARRLKPAPATRFYGVDDFR